MFGLRLPGLLIILLFLVALFGGKKLPELGDALANDDADVKEAKSPDQLPAATASTTPAATDAEKAHKLNEWALPHFPTK